MKKILLPLLTLIFFAVYSPSVKAASLDVSKSANFSSEDLNFDAGERVYTRVETDGQGSAKRILNIRNNQYNLIRSVDLVQSGNNFSASFDAPSSEGYYSLEAVIEGDGASSKSVKTIKVGSPKSANIRVNVNSSVKGEKSQSQSSLQDKQSESEKSEGQKNQDQENDVSPTPEVYGVMDNKADDNSGNEKTSFSWVFSVIGVVWSFVWPF